jgi:hypothetical protein
MFTLEINPKLKQHQTVTFKMFSTCKLKSAEFLSVQTLTALIGIASEGHFLQPTGLMKSGKCFLGV